VQRRYANSSGEKQGMAGNASGGPVCSVSPIANAPGLFRPARAAP